MEHMSNTTTQQAVNNLKDNFNDFKSKGVFKIEIDKQDELDFNSQSMTVDPIEVMKETIDNLVYNHKKLKEQVQSLQNNSKIIDIKARVAHNSNTISNLENEFYSLFADFKNSLGKSRFEKLRKQTVGTKITKLVMKLYPSNNYIHSHEKAKKAYYDVTGDRYQGAKNATLEEKIEYWNWLDQQWKILKDY